MRRTPFAMVAVLALGLGTVAAGVRPAPEIGQPAPAFTLPDTRGAQHSLAQYRGKWVVLEWVNYGCPYVQKHYRTGNIPGQQQKW
ncbi:MAG TPA: redoxin domain-containing protein, partial [Longimicrobium sp.]|nr:redoxin domain-containing protein [Longimicrobium sp.]